MEKVTGEITGETIRQALVKRRTAHAEASVYLKHLKPREALREDVSGSQRAYVRTRSGGLVEFTLIDPWDLAERHNAWLADRLEEFAIQGVQQTGHGEALDPYRRAYAKASPAS